MCMQGCDGSVLLDDTIDLQGEKKASINRNALKGFRIIDRIKNKIESDCPGIVSCADILTIAARDAVILVIYIQPKITLMRYLSLLRFRFSANLFTRM